MMNFQCSEAFPPTMSKTPQNMSESSNSILPPINLLVAGGQQLVTKDDQ